MITCHLSPGEGWDAGTLVQRPHRHRPRARALCGASSSLDIAPGGGPRSRPRAATSSPRAADPARPTAFVLWRCQHGPCAPCALAERPGPTHPRPAATAAAAAVGRPAAAGPWCSVAARSRSAAAPGPASGARKAKAVARARPVGPRTRHSRAQPPNRCSGRPGGGVLLRSLASHLHLQPCALRHSGDIPGSGSRTLCAADQPAAAKERGQDQQRSAGARGLRS